MEKQKLERCGYCGSYIRGNEYVSAEELNTLSQEELNSTPAGYCPNAQAEHYEQNSEPRYVTRDMAIDAGDMSLEGQQMW